MASNINPANPIFGNPTTQSVRDNFQAAHDEITALQATVATAPYLPTSGGTMTGPMILAGDPTNPLGAVTKQYSDAKAPVNSPTFTGDPKAPTPASGDNDTSIATSAFVQAAVAPALNGVGRNLIHNSMFNVAQRGPGPTAITSIGVYFTDRWAGLIGGAGDALTTSMVAHTDASRAAIGDEAATQFLSNSITGGSGAANFCQIFQRIEGARRLANKTVTVSFWANAGTALSIGLAIGQALGTGGSLVTDTAPKVVVLSPTWTRYSVQFTVPSLAGKTLGTDYSYTVLKFWLSAGANVAAAAGIGVQSGTINIWGVQVEIGSVLTPLEKPDPRYDLSNCQRFFYVGNFYNASYATVGGITFAQPSNLPVTMRASPTVTPTYTVQTNCGSSTVTSVSLSTLNVATSNIGAGVNWVLQGSYTASADL